jgi:hypothetical protein
MSFCAPGISNGHSSCFDRQGLIRIIENYNHRYPAHTIEYKRNTPNYVLWKRIRDNMSQSCQDNEWCWLDQDFLKNDKTVQSYYKPPIPNKPYKWLSTSDINKVLKQYEKLYPDFAFMGTVPIDFDEVIDEYKNMNVCTMSGGSRNPTNHMINQYGFVFNLDPHDQRGSHWVSMFMKLIGKDKFIGFFDSYGNPPPRQIAKLVRRLKAQVKKCLGVDLPYKCNTVQHQHKGTECGTYSLYFIYKCLMGYSFEEITENIILDDDVNQFRHFFFRPSIYYQDK